MVNSFGESDDAQAKQSPLKTALIIVGVAAAIGTVSYFGWKTDWWQEVLCENEVTSESGLVTITREEYSCNVRIDTDGAHSHVMVGTFTEVDGYSTYREVAMYFVDGTVNDDLRGHNKRLFVSPVVRGGSKLESEVLTMYIPDFCEDVR